MNRKYKSVFIALFLCVALPCAGLPATAPEIQPISADEQEFLQSNAKLWAIDRPSVRTYPGSGAYAEKAGVINIGTGFLEKIRSNIDQTLAEILLKFTLLHELWHLHQFSHEDGTIQPRMLNECVADTMASYRMTQGILDHTEPDTIEALTKQLAASSQLYLVPANLPGTAAQDQNAHDHLTKTQRLLAIHFGQSRATAEWSEPRMGNEKLPYKQLNAYSVRFTLNKDQKREESFTDICRHITRQGGAALKDLYVSDNSSSMEGYGTIKMIQSNVSTIKNFGKRPVHYSFIGISGFKPPIKTPQTDTLIFVDAVIAGADVGPGEEVKISSKIQFPYTQSGGTPFIWLGPLYDEAMVQAKYIGDIPKTLSCTDASEMKTPVLQALIRIGSAASDRFKSLLGEPQFTLGDSGRGVYSLNLSIPDAVAEFMADGSGSGFATIEFQETPSLNQATKQFNDLVAEIKKGCTPVLDNVQAERDKDGDRVFRVPRLTKSSTAWLLLQKIENKKPLDKPGYRAIWFISPYLPIQ
ncbi:hypothetical protein [Massilia sp. S19_KUP03_FR1]|uniref:hypothetical protein n=1 Tax=Massilia sp. S19_KUP03_FR1 TaxID=3025503 RepID=UPI002FCD8E04